MFFERDLRDAHQALINTLVLKRDLFEFLDTAGAQGQPISYVPLIDGGFWLVNHPDTVRQVLTADERVIGKPEFLLQSNRGQHGDGLTSLSGDEWIARRRLVASAFTPALQARAASAAREATIAALAQLAHGDTVDVAQVLSKLITQIAARWILSADVSDHAENNAIPWSEAAGIHYSIDRPAIIGDLMPSQRVRAGDVPVLRERILDRWRQRGNPDDFVGTLRAACIAQRAVLSEAQVCDEIIQLLFASHHTVVSTLIHCIDFLSCHPAQAAYLLEEASVRAGPASADAVERKYTACFLQEVMRFCMPTPLLFRQVKQAHTVGEYALAPGDILVISPYLLHRNPAHFPQPLQFDPLRFRVPPNPYAYLPFGAGPRRCVAHHVALKHMQIIIETVVLAGRFLPLQQAPANRYSVNYPGPPYRARFEHRSDCSTGKSGIPDAWPP